MGWGSAAFAVSLSPETAYHTPPCCIGRRFWFRSKACGFKAHRAPITPIFRMAIFTPLLAISSHDPLSPPMPRRSGQQPWGKEVSEAKTSGASRGCRTLILGLEDRCTAVVLLMHFESQMAVFLRFALKWGCCPNLAPWSRAATGPLPCQLSAARPAPRLVLVLFLFGSTVRRCYLPPISGAAPLRQTEPPPKVPET